MSGCGVSVCMADVEKKLGDWKVAGAFVALREWEKFYAIFIDGSFGSGAGVTGMAKM